MKIILIIFLCTAMKSINCGQFDAPLKIKNIICDFNETWVKVEYCLVKAHSRVKRTAEAKIIVLKPFRSGNLIFNVFKRYNDWKPWVMFNVKMDACKFLSGKSNPYIGIIRHIVNKYTSFNHSCPLLPGPYLIADVDLRQMALGTLILPAGDYRLDINIMGNKNIKVGAFKFIAELWEKH